MYANRYSEWIPCSFLPVGKTNPATVHPQGYPSPAHNPK